MATHKAKPHLTKSRPPQQHGPPRRVAQSGRNSVQGARDPLDVEVRAGTSGVVRLVGDQRRVEQIFLSLLRGLGCGRLQAEPQLRD